MRLNVLSRRIHYWATLFVALPVLVIFTTGILLQVKKQWTWVQPKEFRGTGTAPVVQLDGILASVRQVPSLSTANWDDVTRIDVRPSRGVAKVTMENGWEVQVDLGSGRLLQHAYRRSDLIESLHDGSWFAGDITKLGLFLPAGIALFTMWLTGLWMFWLPFSVKRKRRQAASIPRTTAS